MRPCFSVSASQRKFCRSFGNVPIYRAADQFNIDKLLPDAEITGSNRNDWWIGLFFGALHEEWKPEPLLSILVRAAQRAGKRICLVSVGRSKSSFWTKLEQRYGREITVIDRGEQSTEVISTLLHKADFGIAASPWQLIGKSGTVAAMLDHGLPVIVNRDDFKSSYQTDQPPANDPLLHRCDEQLEMKLLAGLSKRPAIARVDEIAAQLCGRMQELNPSAP